MSKSGVVKPYRNQQKCCFRLSTGGSVNLAPICPRANCRILPGSSYWVQLYPINLRPHICIPWIKCFTEPTGGPGQNYPPNRLLSPISLDVAAILREAEPLLFDQALLEATNKIYRHGRQFKTGFEKSFFCFATNDYDQRETSHSKQVKTVGSKEEGPRRDTLLAPAPLSYLNLFYVRAESASYFANLCFL